MRKIVLTFGLIAGAIMAGMMALAMVFKDQIGFDRGVYVGYASMVLAFLLVYPGVKTYRDTVGGGRVSFGRAFLVGFLITLVASACYVLVWEIIFYNFMPDYLDKYTAYTLDKMRAAGAAEAEVAARQAEMVKFGELYKNNIFVNIGLTLLEPLPVALLASLVSAALLSRKPAQRAATPQTA
jgi:hypothetical protein